MLIEQPPDRIRLLYLIGTLYAAAAAAAAVAAAPSGATFQEVALRSDGWTSDDDVCCGPSGVWPGWLVCSAIRPIENMTQIPALVEYLILIDGITGLAADSADLLFIGICIGYH